MRSSVLDAAIARIPLVLSDDQHQQFEILRSELQRWNKRINLTSITDVKSILIKHFSDALFLAPHVQKGARLLDIGSGAGFPVLPLAIVRTDLLCTSVESVAKKASFQRHVARLLGIKVSVVNQRLEDFTPSALGAFDFVTSRAFTDPAAFLALAAPLVAPGGCVVVMGGLMRHDEEDLTSCGERCGLTFKSMLKYSLLHDTGKRFLAIFEKAQ